MKTKTKTKTKEPKELTVSCPQCGAAVGVRCFYSTTNRNPTTLLYSHQPRIAEYKQMQKEKEQQEPKETTAVLHLIKWPRIWGGGYMVDSEQPFSDIMFRHLHAGHEEFSQKVQDLGGIQMLAAAHGWAVKVRKSKDSDFDEE